MYNFCNRGPRGPRGPGLSGSKINNIDGVIESYELTKRTPTNVPVSIPNLTGNVNGIPKSSGIAAVSINGGNVASGDYSFASGLGTQALGNASSSFGISSIASGIASSAFGVATRALGTGAHAEGGASVASGMYSHAEGDPTTASGYASHAEGIGCTASGYASHAEGDLSTASGQGAHAEGNGCTASGFYTHAEGQFTIASGTNAHAEGASTRSSGLGSHAEGVNSFASFTAAHAEGRGCTASAVNSHAEGFLTLTSGSNAHAEGTLTVASGPNSHAEGNTCVALGQNSHSQGFGCTASAFVSHAEGNSTISDIEGVHIMGTFGRAATGIVGVTGTGENGGIYSWQLAGGSAPPVNSGDGISAIIRTATFGTPQPIGEMITNYFTAANADYGEYFEWKDGNINNEDRIGYFVQLVNDKIEIADNPENAIGITSDTSNIKGNGSELGWHKTNQTDEFGRIKTKLSYKISMDPILKNFGLEYTSSAEDKEQIIEDIIEGNRCNILAKYLHEHHIEKQESLAMDAPTEADACETALKELEEQIINDLKQQLQNVYPMKTTCVCDEYDPNKPYIPRSLRKEWIVVGLLGQIHVRDDGTCIPGQKCDCKNGIAVPGNKYFVLSRTHPNVIRILFK
jgi:trimeric autotransporter adhesin